MATEYVVLRRNLDAGGWEEVATVEDANTDIQAIRKAAGEGAEGTFAAVPLRSFRPRTRKVETKTVDRWS